MYDSYDAVSPFEPTSIWTFLIIFGKLLSGRHTVYRALGAYIENAPPMWRCIFVAPRGIEPRFKV